MRSSERRKEALGGDEVSGAKRRKLGELRWRVAVLCARSGGERAGERERESAPGGGESGEGADAVHSRGEVVAPASRTCRPRGAVSLTRSGARGAAVSERAGREVDAAWAGVG